MRNVNNTPENSGGFLGKLFSSHSPCDIYHLIVPNPFHDP
jgi:hypothetical protein